MWYAKEVEVMKELKNLFADIKPIGKGCESIAKEHISNLTMPHWALGDVLNIGVKLAGIQNTFPPIIDKKSIYVFACDHGITEENVSLFPKEVTTQMVHNFTSGGAAINVLSRHAKAKTIIVDVGVDADFSELINENKIIDRKISRGTRNFYRQNAMTEIEALQSIKIGFDLVKDSHEATEVYAIGEMGIGNTTTSAAIVSVLINKEVEDVTGLGTGINEETHKHKINIIKEAIIRRNITADMSPFEILERIGSYEIGAMAGMCLGCAYYSRPIVIDGFISSTAALLASKINPLVKEYMFLAHKSIEPGHRYINENLGLKPILDLNMRLGEGSGTPLAMNILEASCKILSEMATFESANVSREE